VELIEVMQELQSKYVPNVRSEEELQEIEAR